MLSMSQLHGFNAGDQSSLREVLRVEFDGDNGSTAIVDLYGHTVTVGGNVKISTVQSVYGGSSGLFDGNGDYVWFDDSADFNFGSQNFEIEFSVFLNSIANRYGIAGQCDNSGQGITTSFQVQGNGGAIAFLVWCNDGTSVSITDSSVSTSTWYTYVFRRVGNSLYLDRGGVNLGTADMTGKTIRNSGYKLGIGSLGEYVSEPANSTFGTVLNGFVDRFIIRKP